MAVKRVGYRITGTVQGVGFRDFVAKNAMRMGLVGFVSNTLDGAVVGAAQGDAGALDGLLAAMKQGPKAAKVEKLETWDLPIEKDARFEIRRDMR